MHNFLPKYYVDNYVVRSFQPSLLQFSSVKKYYCSQDGTLLRVDRSQAPYYYLDRGLGSYNHLWILFSLGGRRSELASFPEAVPKHRRG